VDAAGDAGTGADSAGTDSAGADGPIIETLDVAKHFSAGAKVPGQAKPTLKAVENVGVGGHRACAGVPEVIVNESPSVVKERWMEVDYLHFVGKAAAVPDAAPKLPV